MQETQKDNDIFFALAVLKFDNLVLSTFPHTKHVPLPMT